ncbi:MAG: ABC transporter ATP-binding protein/permease [Eubacteriales bacterium]|nr:ABC transporter ATP-binding protein/permease [Eubacteriales bacterium]
MLELSEIKKRYPVGDGYVDALKGVNISFRESEFVAILGPSGCGKTTLLNIIGGLDRYTSGDLVINGVSTKLYRDRDWDTYRNHSIGFIFQSYNLIPHQSVLSNVELALTISGVSRDERRKRAIEALQKVGLGDQLSKKPNQMSGGQMQRVAIARALVNDPDILLADEPTGALDSATSIQVMEILREISKDKLIIMVTHNPELAEKYANRIVRLKDGIITDDSNPYDTKKENVADDKNIAEKHIAKELKKGKKTSMSFLTALSLSFKNLMTKKTRTILTAFAGSIGIIGIALILSVSSGFQAYVDTIERNTVSGYPITITETTVDMTSVMTGLMGDNNKSDREPGKIYSNDIMVTMMQNVAMGTTFNNLKAFREYIENGDGGDMKQWASDIKYSYATTLNTYLRYEKDGSVSYRSGLSDIGELFDEIGMSGYSSMMSSSDVWTELIGDNEYIQTQYDILSGRLPENKNEIVVITDEEGQISDFVLYCLGIRDVQELKDFLIEASAKIANGEKVQNNIKPTSYTYEELMSYDFRVLADSDYYKMSDGKIVERSGSEINGLLENTADNGSVALKIVGIVKSDNATTGGIGYKTELMTSMIERANGSDVVVAQKNSPDNDLMNGKVPFKVYTDADDAATVKADLLENKDFKKQLAYFRIEHSDDIPQTVPDSMLYEIYLHASGATYVDMANKYLAQNTYSGNLKKLGYVDFSTPKSISIYPSDFESKDKITEIISRYNNSVEEADKITYTDMVAMLMSSVTTIVNAVSYVLVAFVSISLVVSSIMIGIITYISVLERTKEIGILRAIGASKKDISRVFNAETIIVGFTAGLIGIVVSLILIIPINIVLHALTGISELSAVLPPVAAVILVAISVFLTFIAGLIPSGLAAKKDPVIALRAE